MTYMHMHMCMHMHMHMCMHMHMHMYMYMYMCVDMCRCMPRHRNTHWLSRGGSEHTCPHGTFPISPVEHSERGTESEQLYLSKTRKLARP